MMRVECSLSIPIKSCTAFHFKCSAPGNVFVKDTSDDIKRSINLLSSWQPCYVNYLATYNFPSKQVYIYSFHSHWYTLIH